MKILLIEDNVSLATLTKMQLEEEGYPVQMVHDGLEGLQMMAADPADIVITDIRLPSLSGHEILGQLQQSHPDVPVIVITAHGSIPDAVGAIKSGAYDYITKPFDSDAFLRLIAKAARYRRLQQENQQLKRYVKNSITPNIIGDSAPLKALMEMVKTVAPTDAAVLITGESGTGKELIARQIHCDSNRADKQMITVNCAAIPDHLFESELFGHKKGAFTGADKDYNGKIAEADGGTLFLDEIGDLPQTVQAKILRFLQEGEIQPVGSAQPVKMNTRILTATNTDLKQQIEDGTFREDLFYRLNVFPINVPPLRARTEDIPLLVDAFIQKYGSRHTTIATSALKQLTQYRWPGNIRELENTVYRLCILAKDTEISTVNLPSDICTEGTQCLNMELPENELNLEQLEKTIITKALEKFEGNQSQTAKYLCVPRHVLIYRLEKYGLKPPAES